MAITRRTFIAASAAAAAMPRVSLGSDGESPSTDRVRWCANIEMWWRRFPVAARIAAAAAAGFDAVEFWPWRNKDIDEIAAVAKDHGVEIAQFTGWGFVPGLNDPKNHDHFVEEVRAGCKTAHRLSCTRMTIVGGNDQPGMTQEEMHGHIIDGLRRAAPVAESEGIMLILEPMNIRVDHPGHCLYGSEDAVAICRAVDSPMVKINWDLYHMQISEGDLCGRLRGGFDQVGYIQVADHPGRHEPGTGEINYGYVLQELHTLGYRGPIGVEASPQDDEKIATRRLAAVARWDDDP